MRIGVIGVNHKLASLRLRECFAKICQQRFCSSQSTHGSHTLVLLTTCNRTEVYFSSSSDLADTHSYILNILRADLHDIKENFDQKLYSYFGHDCFKHLARVTAGLDSAIVAETEIQGQVKAAYENGSRFLSLPCEMHFLFQKALKIGKLIRNKLPPGRGVPDLEHAVLNAGFHIFDKPESSKVLFVGVSEINCKILSFLKKKNFNDITICNRTAEKARTVSDKWSLSVLEWSRVGDWHAYDMIIFGTKSPNHLISKKDLSSPLTRHKLIIDLCVPRNVDPKLGRNARITLLNMDQLNRMLKIRKKRMFHLLSHAEDIVHESTEQQIKLFHEKEQKRRHYLAVS